MRNDLLESVYDGAVNALAYLSEGEVQQLTAVDSALIVEAIYDIASLQDLRRQLAGRLRDQLSTAWIAEGKLCDVFGVLTALWQYDPHCVTGEYLACAIQRLVKSEVAVGGPYYSETKAISIAANLQIALFMREVAHPLPKVEAYIQNFVNHGDLNCSEVSQSELLRLLSKFGVCPRLDSYVRAHWRDTPWQAPQYLLISLVTLCQEGASSSRATQIFRRLAACQLENGFWASDRHAYSQNLKPCLVITATLVGELARFRQQPQQAHSEGLRQRHQTILCATQNLFRSCDGPLRSSGLSVVDQICKADEHFEITLLPFFFARSLKVSPALTNQQYVALGLANVCTWVAYSIYDDFLDCQGSPAQLPIANTALRASLSCFRAALPMHEIFQCYIAAVFTTMDEANAWEVSQCRFKVDSGAVTITSLPYYRSGGVLADRAFAHVLAPVLLATLGSASSSQVRHIKSAFRHYLIARQLNDDMRDWQEDIETGQASYVVTAILRDAAIKPGTYNLLTLIDTMQRCFWRTTMPIVARRALRHIAKSREAFNKSELLLPKSDIYTFLDSVEVSVRLSLDMRAKCQALASRPHDN